MNETSETLAVVVERDFPHPPEKLWRALTEPHLIGEWLMQNDFSPVVGHRFQFRAQPQPGWSGIIDCQVLVVEPLKTLAYSWAGGDGPLAVRTTVTLSLTPAGKGTHLRMEQAGFPAGQKQNYHGARHGWQHFLERLGEVAGRAV
jgi:uncharacterized protein YndB with AHSA1/START domain